MTVLEKACAKATAAPEYKAIIERLGAEPRYLPGSDFRKMFEQDFDCQCRGDPGRRPWRQPLNSGRVSILLIMQLGLVGQWPTSQRQTSQWPTKPLAQASG